VDAVEAWEAGEFDVILTDNQMPKMGGLEAVRCIREREIATGRRRTRVVALSASAMIGGAGVVGVEGPAVLPRHGGGKTVAQRAKPALPEARQRAKTTREKGRSRDREGHH
jgi:CheY-like chemotaxis protein